MTKRFRPEIEGVRFVAALLVAGYHIWSGRVSGGVDVFFVMSGFLITTTLLSQLITHGRITPVAYLSRLALRLFPAALTTLVAVLIASRLLLPELSWAKIGAEARASALYFQNWYLTATSTDYLGQFEEKTPVQHFWALSLQGQFYVAWLLLFLVLALLIRRRPEHAVRIILGGLTLVFVTSLTYSIWLTEVNQPVAYFSTPARGWEFALGGLAAVALRNPPQARSWLRWGLGWLGLAVLLTTGLLLQVSTVFPGYAALLPTGAALLILVASHNGVRGGADALLSTRPLVWLGGISYGLYLWHFPLLAFHRNLTETETTSVPTGIALILTAILLSWLTQRLVERPLLAFTRRSARSKRIGLTGLLATLTAVVVVASLLAPNRASAQTLAAFDALATRLSTSAYSLQPCTGALAREPANIAECAKSPIDELVPPPALVPDTQKALPCETEHQDGNLRICEGGVPADQARATAMLIGDSHSLTMRPALELVAKHNGWRLLFSYSPGCQTAASPKEGDTAERCADWLSTLTRYLRDRAGEIDVLFSMQAADKNLIGVKEEDRTEATMAEYRKQWDRYQDAVGEIVVIRDTPRLSMTLLTCIGRFEIDEAAAECSRLRTTALKPDYAALAAAEDDDPRTRVVDVSHIFCDETRCYPIVGEFIAYRDSAHLHSLFAPTLTPVLDRTIRQAVTPATRERLFGR